MLMVFLNWLYILLTSFILGFGILSLFTRNVTCKIKKITYIVLAGLATVTVYAQIYSLFAGVSLFANLFLIILCVLLSIILRRDIITFFSEWNGDVRKNKWLIVIYVLLFLVFLYGTSRGYMHFDTGLYHAQSIRWIEEYGVVPGLANLQARFAYNSSAFALNAIYSLHFLVGQSLHSTAGLLALLSAFLTVDIYKVFINKQPKLSDFIRVSIIFYLGVIYSEMVSPASDYYAQLIIYDALLIWTTLDEEYQDSDDKTKYAPYSLLCLLLVFGITIKFSIAFMLFLVIKPAYLLIKNKKHLKILLYLLSGFLITLPFFIRNILISGWLLYPSTLIDVISTDWKIPKGQAQYDAMEIGVYGKGINDVTKWNTPFCSWLPGWFEGLKSLEKVWVILTLIAVFIGILYTIRVIIKRKHEKRAMDFLLLFWVLTSSTLFWFFTAPLIRYGYSYVTVLPLITFGYFYLCIYNKYLRTRKILSNLFIVTLILFFGFRFKGLFFDIRSTLLQNYYIYQEDYIDGDAKTYDVDGITIYVPLNQGQIGYNKFPSSPIIQNIELRGKSIKDGFRQKGD